jgi:macrolide-specific efflux system membrane fusion protein
MSRKLLTAISLALLALVVASAYSQSPLATGRTISVEDALVTLIDDNKVPASDAGRITAFHVKEGEAVEKDALLVDIDNRETLAKKRIAESELKAAEMAANSDAELDVANKAVKVAELELASMQDIREGVKAAVTLTELRKYQFQLDRALAQVRQATVEKSIAAQTAEVKRAQLDAADIELDRRQIKSLFNGQVDEIYKKVGDWCQPGDVIMQVIRLDRVRIKGFVLASQAAPSEVMGKPAVITVYGAGNKQHTLKGTVGHASFEIEGISASRQYRIWVDVDNEKVIDPVTKKETGAWKIEPGVPANMTIDLTPPPPPRPVVAPKVTPVKSGSTPAATPATTPPGTAPKSGGSFYAPPAGKTIPATPAPAGKVEALKPAVKDR